MSESRTLFVWKCFSESSQHLKRAAQAWRGVGAGGLVYREFQDSQATERAGLEKTKTEKKEGRNGGMEGG